MTRLTPLMVALALCLPSITMAAASEHEASAISQQWSLAEAIRAADNEMVREHLRAGANPNGALYDNPFGSEDGSTPFMVAAAEGNAEAMRLMIEAGADLDLTIGFHGSALHAAARYGRLDAARLLLDAGANGDIRDPIYKATPLIAAVWRGHESVVALLLARGACVDCEHLADDGGSYTALFNATIRGHTAIVEHLLAAGADVNTPIGDGHFFGTPLAHAAASGKAEIMEILMAAGAEVNSSGDTPLHAAAARGHLDIVEHLVALGADLDARNPDDRTALTLARNRGHDAVAAYLMAAGAYQ